MAYINSICGSYCLFASSKDDRCNCPWCEVTYRQLMLLPPTAAQRAAYEKLKLTNPSKSEKNSLYVGAQARTFVRLCWLAHEPVPADVLKADESQFPFTCPGCNAVILKKSPYYFPQQDVSIDIQRHGNDKPQVTDAYQVKHKGVSPHRLPLLPLDPAFHIGCALHLMLSICGTLWEHGICCHLVGPERQARADMLNAKLAELAIHP